jgi:hypothetical protein
LHFAAIPQDGQGDNIARVIIAQHFAQRLMLSTFLPSTAVMISPPTDFIAVD